MPKVKVNIGNDKLKITEGEFVSCLYKFFTGRSPTDDEKQALLDILEECKD